MPGHLPYITASHQIQESNARQTKSIRNI